MSRRRGERDGWKRISVHIAAQPLNTSQIAAIELQLKELGRRALELAAAEASALKGIALESTSTEEDSGGQ